MLIGVVPGEQQIHVRNTSKSFTFNHVFGPEYVQKKFYKTAIRGMVNKIFKGYNVTIFTYGQTGSGKTHSLGMNYSGEENMGIIPRAIYQLFDLMEMMTNHTFKVVDSVMELYLGQFYDPLSEKKSERAKSRDSRSRELHKDGRSYGAGSYR